MQNKKWRDKIMEIEQNRITIWDSMKGIAIIGIFLVHN